MRIFLGILLFLGGLPTLLSAQNVGCQAAFTLGPDQLLCFPESSTLIQVESQWEILGISWTLPSGATLLDSLTVQANTTGTVQVIAQAALQSPNLIINGDFSDGNSGFTSELIHSPFTLLIPNTYAITTNPANIHPDYLPCSDHTTGMGRMLASNGNLQPNRNVWCQNVPVEPNGEYEISFWTSALTENELPELVVRVDGQDLTAPLIPGPTTCEWITTSVIWTAGMQTNAQVCIRNLNGSNSGNDFALDDISMIQYCTAIDTITITHRPLNETHLDTLICAGESIQAGGQIFNESMSQVLVLTDFMGCDSLVVLDLVVIDAGLAILVPETITCADTSVVLTASSAFPGGSAALQWLDSNGMPIPGGDQMSVEVDQPGWYTFQWTFSTANGSCTLSQMVEVEQDTLKPLVQAGPDKALTCRVDTLLLNPTTTGSGGLNFLWINLDGAPPVPATFQQATVYIPGRYVIHVLQLVNGCVGTDTVVITDERRSLVLSGIEIKSPFCEEDNGSLDVLGIQGGVLPINYALTDEMGVEVPGGPGFKGLVPGEYLLQVIDADGCKGEALVTVPFGVTPTLFLPQNIPGKAGESLLVTPILDVPFDDVSLFTWTSDNLLVACPECPATEISGLGQGLLRLCIVFEPDCEICAETNIIFEGLSHILYLPNAFSPNDDGINDLFGPYLSGNIIQSFDKFQIFDRWGGLAFDWMGDKVGNSPPVWDGKRAGEAFPTGLYVYLLEATLLDGSARKWSGEVFLIK